MQAERKDSDSVEMEAEIEQASPAVAGCEDEAQDKAMIGGDDGTGPTTKADEAATSAASETAPSAIATSEPGPKTEPAHDAANEHEQPAADTEKTPEQVQAAGSTDQPCSEEPKTDAAQSADQPCPAFTESEAAGEDSCQKSVETAKPADTAASEPANAPSQDTPAETQEQPQTKQSEDATAEPAHQSTSDASAETIEAKPVKTSTEPTLEAKQVSEPHQDDQGTEASTTGPSLEAAPAEVKSNNGLLIKLTTKVI